MKQPKLPGGHHWFTNDHGERVCTGAMMGRQVDPVEWDYGMAQFPWFMHLQRMETSPCGAYDNGGAYWGAGDRRIGWIYIAFSRTQDIDIPRIKLFVRAIDRRSAMMQLHDRYPGKLKFHNDESKRT